ncbi:Piso0_005192 [Millerozyma farinosa CBS 7064]|uniref:Piso0_005192 protein n=1 Tax=Pichia sorbitophila (strain ATCC MYA-4447 / BCRC 22081 / CBS 7064 / NBRC 10061 / NRRL Y-12695) TaxID=559304 RepID=G8Y4G4_PICSO|nr:Piso0_005192 [Millerozyma farinosa CBS 7064]
MVDNIKKNSETSSALLEQLVYIDNFMHSGGSGDQTPNLDLDDQLSLDLAAFADDSFVFPDEDKNSAFHNPIEDHNGQHDQLGESFSMDNGDAPASVSNSTTTGARSRKARDLRGSLGVDASHNSTSKHSIDPDESVNPLSQNGDGDPDASTVMQFKEVSDSLNIQSLPKWPVPPGAKSSLESAGLSHEQIDLLSALVAQHQSNHGQASGSQTEPINRRESHDSMSAASPSNALLSPSAAALQSQYDVSFSNHQRAASRASTISSTSSSTSAALGPIDSDLDKRRRNTAASARFRIKKKLKERQMESEISTLNDHIKKSESKIQQLEMENKLLKNLIIEKGSQKSEYELKLLKERARHE